MAKRKKSRGGAKKKPKKAKRKASKSKRMCFVVMPFGGWWNKYYEETYKPAIVSAGLIPRRADDLYRPSPIVSDIWSFTKEASVILADLTGKNPNVLYELGLAHAIAKPAILLSEREDDIPFDLQALRVIIYDKNDPEWGKSLQENIKKAITEVLKAPLESVPSTFVEAKAPNAALSVSKQEKELLSLKQEVKLLRQDVRRGHPSLARAFTLSDLEMHSASHGVHMSEEGVLDVHVPSSDSTIIARNAVLRSVDGHSVSGTTILGVDHQNNDS